MAMVIANEARATWPTGTEWVGIDEELRGNAKRRSGLDAHEMYWLREAERVQIWRPFGMVSMLDYMDRVLGHTPETARKRLRVARALAHLPLISAALERGKLTFSAVRELTRVATSTTERAWIDACVGKSSREIEDRVNGRRPGDMPDDPPDPEATTHVVRFELSAPAYALFRAARLALDEQHGARLEDSQLFEALCNAVRDGGARNTTDGRAKFQIAYTICKRCDQGWQVGGGVRVPVEAAAVERARCDAQHIGSIDGDHPERARQDIPPSVVRFVWARDEGRCQTPGCRSTFGVEIHHLKPVSQGGTHTPPNLTLRCFGCHGGHHEGRITISGIAPDHITVVRNVTVGPAAAHHRPSSPEERHTMRAQAIEALIGLGWKRGVAITAVDEALGHVAHGADVAGLIREALRRCPRPSPA
jgi:hypothetical protein